MKFCKLLKNNVVNLDQNTISIPTRDRGTITSDYTYNRPLTPTEVDLCLYWILYRYLKWLNTQKRMFTFVAIHIPSPLIPRGLPSRFMYVSKNVKRHHKLHALGDFWWMALFIFLWSTQDSFPTIDYACAVTVRWFRAHFLLINDAKSSTAKRRPVWRMPSFSPSSHSPPHIHILRPFLLTSPFQAHFTSLVNSWRAFRKLPQT